MASNRLNAKLKFKLSWRDERLEFLHLSMNKTSCLLNDEINKIWTPNILIKEASYEDNFKLIKISDLLYTGSAVLTKPSVQVVRDGRRSNTDN